MKRFGVALFAAALLGLIPLTGAAAARPSTEQVYADGQQYTMLGVTLKTQGSPGLLSAPPIYLLGFVPSPSLLSNGTVTSGYAPQCDPCDHGAFIYHDHVITGEPGMGTNGTAGKDYAAPWRIVVMLYNPTWSNSPLFTPLTSDEDLHDAIGAGHFLPINQGASGDAAYEIWTTMVLICPLIQAG
jgi:hypothetical protein